jgi:hypothetical protein
MKVWQIATGDAGRNYSEVFFNYDVMIIGGSRQGSALENDYRDGKANSEGSQIHNFAHLPKAGDRVIMRYGKKVIGVGEIPSDEEHSYSFNESFRCVYGWDLCHCRRVNWAKSINIKDLENVFISMKQKPSFSQVHEQRIVELVSEISEMSFRSTLQDLPKLDTSTYELDDLGVELFKVGISNKNIGDILLALEQAERLCSWYDSGSAGRYPTENEVISHIVLPLFLGLGWSHQQIAVEWNRVDMAFFKHTPSNADNCVMILEAKGLWTGLGEVLHQPLAYVEKLQLKGVKHIVVTDGANIFVYERKEEGEWSPEPVAYLSVNFLQKEYIIPKDTDAASTLKLLQPNIV